MVKRGGGPGEGRGVAASAHLRHVEGLVLVVQVPVRLVRHCTKKQLTTERQDLLKCNFRSIGLIYQSKCKFIRVITLPNIIHG